VRRNKHLARNLGLSGAPTLDAYEEVLPLRRQQQHGQRSYLYVLCPHCDVWRIHGRALHETEGLIFRASHCVDCPTEVTGYALRIVGSWNAGTRRQVQGRGKPPVRVTQVRRGNKVNGQLRQPRGYTIY
jgi:hypothetical protein